MMKRIQLLDQDFEYELKRSLRARNMRLTIHVDGRVVVTLPMKASERFVEVFLQRKAKWIFEKRQKFQRLPTRSVHKVSSQDFLALKSSALRLAQERVERWNQIYQFSVGRVSIKNQKTRWGSCSKKKNLNFHVRIVQLPPHLADYLVVHELCHLQEMNHSKRFWDLVARTVPDYIERRRELKKFSL